MKTLTLEDLKNLVQPRVQIETLECHFAPCGIPKGAITEISGIGKTDLVLKFLSEHPELKVAWVEKSFSAYPFRFLQRQVSLNRVLFVEAGEHIDWVTLQVLRAQYFAVVVIYSEYFDTKSLRRIQIATEKAGIATIWLSRSTDEHWQVSLKIKVRRKHSELDVTILKKRFS